MNRRHVLATAGAGCGLSLSLTGCLAGRSGTAGFEAHSPEPTDPPSLPQGPKDPPDRPADATPEAVSEYVADVEYAIAYNRLHCRNPAEIDVSADGALAHETDHGAYAFAAATGFSLCGAGDEPEHTDYGPGPVEWAVGETHAVRIGSGSIETRDATRENGAANDGANAAGLSVTNFDHLSHEIELTVERGGETACEEVLEIDPRSAVRLRNVSAVRGDHEVSVGTDEGAAATGTWSADPERRADWLVRVLATGTVSVERRDPYSVL